jgi:tetratricopeptide (TPR) repeat protein
VTGSRRLRTRRLMALPVLVLAGIAAAAALIGLETPPAWMGWLPPWAATVTAGVLGVLGTWWASPWATRRKATAEAEQQALEELRTHLGRQDHLARIGETSAHALALRVHPALPLPPADRSNDAPGPAVPPTQRRRWLRLPQVGGRIGERPVVLRLDRGLPTFVERDKGREIREALAQAREAGGFIVLVGDSCVGKTRLLYHLARQELADFAVLAPDLGDGNLVNTIASATFPLPKLIIWLDELHRFLKGPYLHDGESAITAATIRQLMQAPTPVVILAAMWPEHASHLRATQPDPVTGRNQPAFPHTVEILTDPRVQQIALDTFSDTERTAAAQLAATDPRLAAALGDRTYNITETLAGAPELVHRYERATQEQQAIIHAAVDARRLGIQAPLTRPLLTAAARGYLTTLHPDDTWFPAALAEVSTADRAQDKATAPLIELLNPERTQSLGYTVADYLLQHLTRQRRTTHLSALTWQALTDHPHPNDDLTRLADSAEQRLLYRYSEQLHRHLAATGHSWAARRLMDLLVGQGRTDDAISLLGRLADSGDSLTAGRLLADLLVRQGRTDELRQRADTGDSMAADRLANLLLGQGRTDEAMPILGRLADSGDSLARYRLVDLLLGQGRTNEVISILGRHADAGDRSAADSLIDLLFGLGRTDEAVSILGRLADTGDRSAAERLANLLGRQGRTDELRQRADAGDSMATYRLANLLREQGRTDEAISILGQLADTGWSMATYRLVGLLRGQGRTNEAISILGRLADAGDSAAADRLANLLVVRGRTDEAVSVLGRLADAGDCTASSRLANLLLGQGRTEETISVLGRLADAGDSTAADRLVDLLLGHGRTDEAISVLGRLADAGDRMAADRLVDLLVKHGRTDEAVSILGRLADAGDSAAAAQLAHLMRGQGRTDEAVSILGRLADAGDSAAAAQLAYLMRGQGRTDELRQRADAGDSMAAARLVDLLVEQGRTDELRCEVTAGTQGAGQKLISILAADEETRAESEKLRRFGLNPNGVIAEKD